jgi:hypothetical protein
LNTCFRTHERELTEVEQKRLTSHMEGKLRRKMMYLHWLHFAQLYSLVLAIRVSLEKGVELGGGKSHLLAGVIRDQNV